MMRDEGFNDASFSLSEMEPIIRSACTRETWESGRMTLGALLRPLFADDTALLAPVL